MHQFLEFMEKDKLQTKINDAVCYIYLNLLLITYRNYLIL